MSTRVPARYRNTSGFTLIEILIVIIVLSILSIMLLVTLNPADAQRKSRDIKRTNDMRNLQAAISQYVLEGGTPVCTGAGGCVSSTALTCDGTGWVSGANLCAYISSLPADPVQGQTKTCVGCAVGGAAMTYQFRMDASGNFEINIRQEATANAANVTNDGGNSTQWVESGSSLTLLN